MSVSAEHLWLILGMSLVTYAPRALPLLILSRRKLPSPLEQWLRFIPPAVLGALLAPELVLHREHDAAGLFLAWENIRLWAALPSLAVAWFTGSFIGTVLTGMGCVALGRYLFPSL